MGTSIQYGHGDVLTKGFGFVLLAVLTLATACKSSDSQPPDALAVEYCALCGERPNCPALIDETINGVCPDQTRAYYVCLTENACDSMSCDAEWQARQVCFVGEGAGSDAGTDGAP